MIDTSAGVHRMTVRSVVTETADAVSIVFDAEPADVRYAAGQFLTIRVPGDAGPVARCYSLSSAPCADPHLQITVKRVDGGYASHWLCDNVVAGTELETLRAAGTFGPTRWDVDFLLVAGGSGITPILSILKTALIEHRNKVTLLYANRDAASVIFGDQLADLVRRYPERLEVIHWLESDSGRPTVSGLRSRLRKRPRGHVFVCGPGPFMNVVDEYVRSEKIARDRVHKEVFVSLTGDVSGAPTAAAPGAEAAHVVAELDGAEHRLRWPKETPLLDVLLAEGLDPQYACREGSCGACAYTLRGGEVKMLANDTLDSHELRKGIRLACQSVPLTDDVHVVFDQ